MDNKELMKIAKQAMKNSYSPYSKFKVGAALLTKNGKVYQGTNIENSSFSATICAERVAVFKAISDGCNEFEKIAIAGSNGDYCYPCGVCRQVMSEFCNENFVIILEKGNVLKEYKLGELLPCSFKLKEEK